MADMSVPGFNDSYNETFVGNGSLGNYTEQQQPDTTGSLRHIIQYVALALGIPGNVLSAIVWLRLHVTSKNNSSVVYLAALAINDLLYLVCICIFLANWDLHRSLKEEADSWFWYITDGVHMTARTIEPLLVLSFSVERLIATVRPLQVVFYMPSTYISFISDTNCQTP